MKPFEHLGLIAPLATGALTLALCGCSSGEAFGPRAVAPAPAAQAEPLPAPAPRPPPPAAPPAHRTPSYEDEPDEALAAQTPPLEAMPSEDVALLDRALSNDLGFEFQLRDRHEPAALSLRCVAGEALLGCAAPPATPSVAVGDEDAGSDAEAPEGDD